MVRCRRSVLSGSLERVHQSRVANTIASIALLPGVKWFGLRIGQLGYLSQRRSQRSRTDRTARLVDHSIRFPGQNLVREELSSLQAVAQHLESE